MKQYLIKPVTNLSELGVLISKANSLKVELGNVIKEIREFDLQIKVEMED